MKSFLIGFIVFLLYAAICVLFLELALPKMGFNLSNPIQNSIVNESSLKDSFKEDPILSKELVFDEQFDTTQTDSTLFDNDTGLDSSVVEDELRENNDPDTERTLNQNSGFPVKFNIALPNGSYLINCNAYSTIYKDVEKVRIPYVCRDYGLAVKSFLAANSSTTLLITGFSDPSESNAIGRSRAEYLKGLLTNTGIDSDRIVTTAAVSELNIEKGYASGGIRMEIRGIVSSSSMISDSTPQTTKITEATSKTVEQQSILSDKKFTSGFQGDYFYGDQKFKSHVLTLKTLLNQHPGSKIYAYSYTNKEGDDKDNYAVSRDNASTVRKILMQSGIKSNRITSIARGEQSSGTSGSNRCVIITVK
ncbi:OmpA family protein [Nonlabens antarcticus]|uniref:OmpA family protein n=1 Tax=Nonlabens antarcticus TaxID=392714 RepID=UPI001891CD9A|nr:OmpA family protein [Nonlabens antarcticus]